MRDRTRITRRARILLVLAAGAALVLPGSAVANHNTCAELGTCPQFTPDQEAGTSFLYTDTPSSLFFRNYQLDHEMPVVDLAYYLPDGWQFAVADLREANDGAPTTCGDLYTGATIPRNLGNAEALSSVVGARIRYDSEPIENLFGDVTTSRLTANYGLTGSNKPNLVFLGWDPTDGDHVGPDGIADTPDDVTHTGVATMCMYWANPGQADTTDPFTGDPINNPNDLPEGSKEFILPVYLYQLPDADPFGWKIDFDIARLTRDAGLSGRNASMIYSNFMLSGVTSGNWNTNPVLGKKEAIVFSRTPADPDDYVFRSELVGCRDGFNPLGSGDACKSTNLVTRVFEEPVRITPAPTTAFHDFAKLTGPGTRVPGTDGGELWGTSFIRSATGTVEVPFNQPTIAPGEKVHAYALALASAGDSPNVHWEYAIVDSADPDFADSGNEKVCGATGADAACKFVLQFPLNAGSKVLSQNGTYDLAIVTIYDDGHRSDKTPTGDAKCDDGTGPGIVCDPADAGFVVNNPGIGQWEFMLRQDAWPVAYNTVQTHGGTSIAVPQYVLLIDYATHRAEFNFWNHKAPTKTFAGSNALTIQGDNGSRIGVLSFGSSEIGGTSERFQFVGLTKQRQFSPFPAPFRDPSAIGELFRYNLRGQPTNGTGVPTGSALLFQTFFPSF